MNNPGKIPNDQNKNAHQKGGEHSPHQGGGQGGQHNPHKTNQGSSQR